MYLGGLTATQVWATTPRSLTKMGALTAGGALNQSLAGAATVSLQPATSVIADMTIAITTNAAAASGTQIILNDGTNQFVIQTVAANATGYIVLHGIQNSTFVQLKNLDATHAATYAYTQKQWAV